MAIGRSREISPPSLTPSRQRHNLQMHCGWIKVGSSRAAEPAPPRLSFTWQSETNISPQPSPFLKWGKGLEGISLSKKQSKLHIIASLNLIPLWNLTTLWAGICHLQFVFKETMYELIVPHKIVLAIFHGTLGLMDHEKNESQLGEKTLTGSLLLYDCQWDLLLFCLNSRKMKLNKSW